MKNGIRTQSGLLGLIVIITLSLFIGCGGSSGDGIDGSDSPVWYADTDNDGYGDPGTSVESDVQPDGYVSNDEDLDDSDPTVNPGLVIVEIMTGTWCMFCPGAAIGADELVENGNRVGVINYHRQDSYETVESSERITYYEIFGYPTAEFDGVLELVGGRQYPDSMYADYLPNYETRIGTQPLFYIDAQYYNTGGNNYRLAVEAKRLGDYAPADPDIVLHAVLTESSIDEDWFGMDELNFVCRDMIPDQNGTALDFDLKTTQSVVLDFTIPAEYVAENLELVVFLQDNSTKEILQGVFAQPTDDME
jgi:thiol-disulfide isomerase/thioredoxin